MRLRKLEIGTSVGLKGLLTGLGNATKKITGWSKGLDKKVDTEALGASIAKSLNKSIQKNLDTKSEKITMPKIAGGFAIGSAITGGLTKTFDVVKGLFGQTFSLAIDKEQTEIAFGTLLGSADKAKEVLGDLSDFGASTPFEFVELADAGKKLLSFGYDVDSLMPKMRQIGDVASALNIPFGDLSEMMGKAKTSGTIYNDTLNEMAGRGIPVFTELAKVLGVPAEQIKDLASSGKIKFQNIEQVFTNLTGEGGKFSGMMEAQSKTVGGLISTLKDNVNLALTTIGEKLFETFNVRDALSSLIGYVSGVGPMVDSAMSYLGMAIEYVKPFVVAASGYLTSIFTNVATVIGQIAPIFFQAISTFSSYLMFLYDAVTSGLSAVAGWIGSAMGMVSSFFGGTGSVMNDFQNNFDSFIKGSVAFLAIFEYGFLHWRDIVAIATNYALHSVVKFGEEIKYLFLVQVPGYLMWFAENGFSIVKNLFMNMFKMFENFGINVVSIFTNLPALISGKVKFGDLLTPLTDGMVAVIDKLPEIPDRIEGDFEKALRQQGEALQHDFTVGLDAHVEATMKDAFGESEQKIEPKIENKIKVPTPTITPPVTEINTQATDTKFANNQEVGSNDARSTLLKHFAGGFKGDKQLDIAEKQLKVQEETLKETKAARKTTPVELVSIA